LVNFLLVSSLELHAKNLKNYPVLPSPWPQFRANPVLSYHCQNSNLHCLNHRKIPPENCVHRNQNPIKILVKVIGFLIYVHVFFSQMKSFLTQNNICIISTCILPYSNSKNVFWIKHQVTTATILWIQLRTPNDLPRLTMRSYDTIISCYYERFCTWLSGCLRYCSKPSNFKC
jgi:hypothetical protein